MAGEQRQIRGLIVPLEGINLAVPDSVILQIVTALQPVSYKNAPRWLLGSLDWQKRRLPAMAFEIAGGLRHTVEGGGRFLVMKSIRDIERMPFYALQIFGMPHPVIFNDDNISAVENAVINSPLVINQVLVKGEIAGIPNLDAIEEMLMSQYGIFTQESTASSVEV